MVFSLSISISISSRNHFYLLFLLFVFLALLPQQLMFSSSLLLSFLPLYSKNHSFLSLYLFPSPDSLTLSIYCLLLSYLLFLSQTSLLLSSNLFSFSLCIFLSSATVLRQTLLSFLYPSSNNLLLSFLSTRPLTEPASLSTVLVLLSLFLLTSSFLHLFSSFLI